ncbi:D-alanyl-D-alanine carboxypeptidase / D-alanyl-D-alanine-endopeptidase (penicillin-binding protein 4) [Ectothiorhodospira mobilis]|uniref:D-alanyl-D-alanine carboxypeptidase / D-alanyl-D-alanine-endopeptidase (Penicillin-binding protein 4) n=1 Tax=Ectothiorhodospira mobilis TaxID=195064 RepID=A0A1I4S0K4_ECTMO|nr:D-alanyl-D-alanine carboxypeptidase/D-alanyl-D-alanine-endopeptidase [Ectothiorhodospira mobilis]SFM57754.1 D-alanyl-D-alanine carboxypeptidase / D-alanyl-D-alanine-endopeptidase (penicillin-binding protein 4) [Ectothiorhodospira mobilis]
MPHRSRLLLRTALVLLLSALAWTGSVSAALPDPLARALERHGVPQAAVSLWVQAPGAARPVIAHRPDVPRNPASTLKLVTTLAALEVLGPAYRWETAVYAPDPVEDGVLQGDLYLRGGGDPFLVSEEVWKLAGALYRSGVRRIRGDLVLDLSRFRLPPEDPGAFDGQPFRAYNQPPHPLLMNFNAVRFELHPQPQAGIVRVAVDPPLAHLQVENRLHLDDHGSCTGPARQVRYHVPEPSRVRLEGGVPTHCGPSTLLRTASGPERYAHDLFRTLWAQWGGVLDGGWRLGRVPDPEAEPLLVHHSPPLGELVRLINKYSNNVMTRQLNLTLGLEVHGSPATPEKGHRVLQDFLRGRGIGLGGFVLDNAAGLSRENRLTARQLAGVLQAGWESPYRPEYIASLALAGMDGTLRRRFQDTPLAGRMHLKTGSLRGVSAVAGYVRTAGGGDRLVVLLIRHPGLTHGQGVSIQDAFLTWVHASD